MTERLYPTPTRLRYLADADAGRLPLLLTLSMAELKDAGWIELVGAIDGPVPPVWRPTAYGRAIREVRIHEREDGKHLVAECGDPDEPRHLGDAWREATNKWLIRVGDGLDATYAARHTVHEARAELRHMAATALAADPTFTATVQEGQTS